MSVGVRRERRPASRGAHRKNRVNPLHANFERDPGVVNGIVLRRADVHKGNLVFALVAPSEEVDLRGAAGCRGARGTQGWG